MHTLFRVSRDENHVFTTTTDNNSDYYLQDGKDVIRLKLHHDTWQHGRIAEFELEKRLSVSQFLINCTMIFKWYEF